MEDIFIELGGDQSLSKQVALQISKSKNHWVGLMMNLELKLERPAKNRAARSAGTIALSYVVGGFIPLLTDIIFSSNKTGFNGSCIATIAALIAFGFYKSKMTGQPIIKGPLKITVTGIIAAAAAFLLAKAVS